MKTNHTLVATHPAFGTVTFGINAADAKTAFSLWKQIVHSSRQWVVQRNESDGSRAALTPEAGTHPHDYDLTAVDDI
jgi:hypothetical protein